MDFRASHFWWPEGYVVQVLSTVMAMAISYNWLFLRDTTGLYIHSINGVSSVLTTCKWYNSGHNCISAIRISIDQTTWAMKTSLMFHPHSSLNPYVRCENFIRIPCKSPLDPSLKSHSSPIFNGFFTSTACQLMGHDWCPHWTSPNH